MAININPASGIIEAIGSIIDKAIPDVAANEAAKAALLQTEIQGQINNAISQIQLDNTEAAQPGIFGQWRDALGWICVLSFGWIYIVMPIAAFILANLTGHQPLFPTLDQSQLSTILMAMLGLGGLHAAEKITGIVQNNGQ